MIKYIFLLVAFFCLIAGCGGSPNPEFKQIYHNAKKATPDPKDFEEITKFNLSLLRILIS